MSSLKTGDIEIPKFPIIGTQCKIWLFRTIIGGFQSGKLGLSLKIDPKIAENGAFSSLAMTAHFWITFPVYWWGSRLGDFDQKFQELSRVKLLSFSFYWLVWTISFEIGDEIDQNWPNQASFCGQIKCSTWSQWNLIKFVGQVPLPIM